MEMAKEPRAEVTRRAIINSAATSFINDGYSSASLNEMCARAGVTKGAMYFHFSTKEELARALVAVYTDKLLDTLGSMPVQSGMGIESLIDWTFAVSKVIATDTQTKAGARMMQEIGRQNGVSDSFMAQIASQVEAHLEQAALSGDVQSELSMELVSQNLVMQLRGLQEEAAGDSKAFKGFVQALNVWWQLTLTALVPLSRRSYFYEFLRRRTDRAQAEFAG